MNVSNTAKRIFADERNQNFHTYPVLEKIVRKP